MKSDVTNVALAEKPKIVETSPAEILEQKPLRTGSPRGVLLVLAAAAVVLMVVIAFGIHSRLAAETRVQQATGQAADSNRDCDTSATGRIALKSWCYRAIPKPSSILQFMHEPTDI